MKRSEFALNPPNALESDEWMKSGYLCNVFHLSFLLPKFYIQLLRSKRIHTLIIFFSTNAYLHNKRIWMTSAYWSAYSSSGLAYFSRFFSKRPAIVDSIHVYLSKVSATFLLLCSMKRLNSDLKTVRVVHSCINHRMNSIVYVNVLNITFLAQLMTAERDERLTLDYHR